VKKRGLQNTEGDIVEIGAFVGGGTVKLAKFAGEFSKKVYVIDLFDPSFDKTEDINGNKMCDIYQALLQGHSQLEVYQEITQGFDNIITIKEDSQKVKFPKEQSFIFGFIDGNHQPEYIRNDFYIVWTNLVSGGVIGFHDYNYDLPEVTKTVDSLIAEHKNEIKEVSEIKSRHVVLLIKSQFRDLSYLEERKIPIPI
jgi:hypothetical protein